MSRVAYFIFSTSGVVDLIGASAIWLALRPRSVAARRTIVALALAYLVVSIYAVPAVVADLLARPYHRFETADVPSGRVALVIFGAGVEEVTVWQTRIGVPNAIAAARVLEAVRVYHIAQPRWVISSGGNPSPDDDREPAGANMRGQLVQLGIPANRIVVETTSSDSRDEAVIVAPMLRSLGAEKAILVTSAIHMRRSAGACRAAGWNPTPAIAPDPWFQDGWDDWLLPSNRGLYFSNDVVHELLACRITGGEGGCDDLACRADEAASGSPRCGSRSVRRRVRARCARDSDRARCVHRPARQAWRRLRADVA